MSTDKLNNFIGGEFVEPATGKWFENYEPATGKVLCEVPDSTKKDISAAIKSAKDAFPIWSKTPVAERAKYMHKMAQIIEKNLMAFARAESDDVGKPLSLAMSLDIPRAVANLRFFAGAVQGFSSDSHAMEIGVINYTLRQPVGVVGCISPWNLPLYLLTWKIAPALAAGCTVVAKPSELSPLTASMLCEAANEAGLPPGVLNIVHGFGAKTAAHFSDHPDIAAISFTGGTETGKTIALSAASHFKKLALEMGGKNPYIICADADYEDALKMAILAGFRNQGEICLCGSRFLIEESIYEKFRDDFVPRVRNLKVGDPRKDETDIGALISRAHYEKVLNYIALAQQEGGTILTGGEPVRVNHRCADGNFVAPTVIEGLPLDCRTNQEEVFGPLVTIAPFKTDEELLQNANGTDYGLAASLWTNDLNRAHQLSGQLDFGVVWVNTWMLRDLRTPFGGAKMSGLGREGGLEALNFFTDPKNVCIKYG